MFEPDPPPAEDDVLDVGRDPAGRVAWLAARLPGLRFVTAAAACVGLTVAVVAALHPGATTDGAGRVAAPLGRAAALQHPPTPASTARSYDGPIRAVQALAGYHGTLPTYVRQTSPAGACALVRRGHSPKRAVVRALRRFLPRYRVRDIGTVLDQFTGLCALQLRADNVAGAVLVVSLASPAGHHVRTSYNRVQTGFELAPHAATKYAAVTTRGGFSVLVGATGPLRSLPEDRQLSELADDAALTW